MAGDAPWSRARRAVERRGQRSAGPPGALPEDGRAGPEPIARAERAPDHPGSERLSPLLPRAPRELPDRGDLPLARKAATADVVDRGASLQGMSAPASAVVRKRRT